MKIIINEKTPTVNHLYWHRGNIKIMKKEAKALRETIIEETMKQSTEQGYKQQEWRESLLRATVVISENWYNKNHTIKRKDLTNRDKFLIDSIFMGLRLDDSQLWEITFKKKEETDPKEFKAEITIEFYTP